MITEVRLPELGANIKEAVILRWLIAEGDAVQRGDVLAEIETEKANLEFESEHGGVLRRRLVAEGETVQVGTAIAIIGDRTEDLAASDGPLSKTTQKAALVETELAEEAGSPDPAGAPYAAKPQSSVSKLQKDLGVLVSPLAQRLAAEFAIDLAEIKGSGSNGRILLRDVEARLAPRAGENQGVMIRSNDAPVTPAPVPPSRIRQAIAKRLTESKQTIPHYYLQIDIDMKEAVRLRTEQNENLSEANRISINDLIVIAVARALLDHKKFNAWFIDGRVEPQSKINIGVVVALDEGLLVPAVPDCGRKGLLEISAQVRDLAARARSGGLKPEEMSSATFTISNLGNMGTQSMVAIINPPQVAIITAGVVEDRAVVRSGSVTVRPMMSMVLSADHRVSDGADAAQFLQAIRANLEKPELMLL